MQAPRKDSDLLGDAAAGRVDKVQHGHAEPLRLLLDAHDLLDRLLPPGSRLDGVVVGHDGGGAAADEPDSGDDAVGGGVRLRAAGEEPVLLEDRTGIEEQPEPVPREQLARFAELVPVLLMTLLDACTLVEVPLFTHADGLLSRLASPARDPTRTGGQF